MGWGTRTTDWARRLDRTFPKAIKAALFADVVGSTHLLEHQFVAFVDHYLQAISHLLERTSYQPEIKNT